MRLDRQDALRSETERQQRRGPCRALISPLRRAGHRPVEKWLMRAQGPLFPTDKAI
jgi:hypothetical protein